MSTPDHRLELANARAATRARVKRDLASGTLDPVSLIFEARPELDDCMVVELLNFVRGLPPRAVNAGFDELRIPATQTMAKLNAAERTDIARWLHRNGFAGGA